jgi:SecD/SecF fusion protein
MRNKATIVVLLAIFSVICLVNLFFTYRAFSMESQLRNSSPADEAALRRDKDFMASYEQAQRNAFSLGLDLQGGLFLTMEVGVEDILRTYAGTAADEDFNTALTNALKEKETSQSSLVELFSKNLLSVYQAKNRTIPQMPNGERLLMARYFGSQARNIPSTATDAEVVSRLQEDTKAAISNAYTIIRSRVDQFGVASPNLNLDEATGRIFLELPGVRDPERVIKLLRNSAKLEFRETWMLGEISATLDRMDAVVKRKIETGSGSEITAVDSAGIAGDSATAAKPDTTLAVAPKDSDSATVAGVLGGANDTANKAGADSMAGLSDDEKIAKFKKSNPFRGLFNLRFQGLRADYPLIGVANPADTTEINKWLNDPEVKAVVRGDVKFLWEAKADPDRTGFESEIGLIAVKTNREDKAPLGGEAIENATQDFEPGSTAPIVSMKMNAEGGSRWARLTKENIGRCVAIVLDNYVQSYPVVQNMIMGGNSQISGNFTVEEAKDLANLLKAGALPVKVRILGSSTVGPSMGEENRSKGMVSFVVAFFAVCLFMIVYYSKSGWVASVALIINLIFLLAVSAALNVVFTLPGLAAVVLTMGMAVDANVLIYERIREEQAKGKGYKAALQAGFSNAFSSIMDSNITTFLTGLILFAFGIGPIRGFAVALMIGIVTSLIAALFVTRLILEYFSDRGTEISFFSAVANRIPKFNIQFEKRKNFFYGFSAVLTILSLVSIFTLGFRTGVDFKGGRQMKVSFNKEVNANDFRQALTDAYKGETPLVRTVSGEQPTLLITTSYMVDQDIQTNVIDSLTLTAIEKAKPGLEPSITESTTVGPTVAADIKVSAVYSVIFSLIVIFVYILVRFRRVSFSVGSVASLFHDVALAMGTFSFFGVMDLLPFPLEVDQAFIAAVLTIIGYSINDTVIVFDRIRENMVEMKSSKLGDIFEASINQTLARTIITSGTTLLTVVVLLIFAGDVVRAFMFALLIGIGVGTYSSVFVASPIAFDMMTAQERAAEKKSSPAKA